jgi:aspartate racemase
MKTIGLIGGLSWESSLEYYRLINQGVKRRLGGLHSARCLLYSFDFAEIEALQHQGSWEVATHRLIEAAHRLAAGGADFIIICSNTMHKMADELMSQIHLPLLHIADATAQRIAAQGIKTVGLLGTKFTMEQDFYRGRLADKYDLKVLIPSDRERAIVHDIIYGELCQGVINPDSRTRYRDILKSLVAAGAEAIVLGCTEITLLVQQTDSPVLLFDTTAIHAQAAVDYAFEQ